MIFNKKTEDGRLEAIRTRKRKSTISKLKLQKKSFGIILKKKSAFFSKTERNDEKKDSVKPTS